MAPANMTPRERMEVSDDEFEGRTGVREQLLPEPMRFGKMVGHSASMGLLFELLQRAAMNDATVLIEGETGTGKEAMAEAIHHESLRHSGPFVVVDCGAMPPDLLETELFGHEGGASRGGAPRQSAFEAASRGTIFLDEIAELRLDLQTKLWRVLDRGQVKRVGATTYAKFDVRVIAATQRRLRAEVHAKRFRSDLYYRLAVMQVRMPPLRERMADIPILVDHILGTLGVSDERTLIALHSQEFLDRVARYRWPGNIRQLRNYIERCVALDNTSLSPNPEQSASERPPSEAIDISEPLRTAREQWVSTFERRYLEALLRKHNDNVSAAARAAEVDRIHFYRLLWKHGLRVQAPERQGATNDE
ncbi:MAG TPA: sigma-54 dependent transcriptional regulator [Polyangiaceae bacterium]